MKLPDNQCSDFIRPDITEGISADILQHGLQYSGHVNDSVFISEYTDTHDITSWVSVIIIFLFTD